MNARERHLIDYATKVEHRRSTPDHRSRLCACCGDTGEFDDLAVVHTAHHLQAMRREFGGDCCIECCDWLASCDRCGAVDFGMRSQVHGDERLCASCEGGM